MKFTFEITETLQRRVSVEAETREDAHLKVLEMYRSEEIVLDSSDYIDTEISFVGD